MPAPFDDMGLPAGAWLPPWEATPQPPPQAPWEVPTDVGAAPSLGVPQLQAPEAPPEMAPAEQPQQAAPFGLPMPDPTSVPPGSRVKVSQSSSGYAPAAYKPRDPMAPLVKAEAEQRALTDQSAAAIEELGRLEAAKAEHVDNWALEQKQAQLDQNERDRLEVMGAFETERAQQNARIQQAIAEIPQRDPKRWWKNMDDFQRASAYMSASIDGYLNPGGVNQTVEQANKIAEADAYAQMTDIDTAKAKVGYQQSAYERLLGEHEFKRQAFLEQKAYRLESLAVAIEQRGMAFKSPITQQKHLIEANKIRAEGQRTLATLAGQQADALNAAANRALQERLQKSAQAFELAKEERARKAAEEKARGESILGDPATGKNWFITKQTADREGRLKHWSDKDDGISTYSSMLTGANGSGGLKAYTAKLNAFGRSYKGPGANTAAVISDREQIRSELVALRQQIIAEYRHGLFGGALTDTENKNFDAMVPDPAGLTGPTSTKALETFIKTKAGEAQSKFINPMGIADEQGRPVDVVKEWGTIEIKDQDPGSLDAYELIDSGNQVAAAIGTPAAPLAQHGPEPGVNLSSQPDPVRPKETAEGRAQAKLLEARANELVSRSKNYAARSSMTPEVGAQAVQTLHQWAAMANAAGSTDVADKITAKALELETQITSERPVFEVKPDPQIQPGGGVNLRTYMPAPR